MIKKKMPWQKFKIINFICMHTLIYRGRVPEPSLSITDCALKHRYCGLNSFTVEKSDQIGTRLEMPEKLLLKISTSD